MSTYQKVSLVILRLTLGWLFFYAGITKILNPDWSAEGYIRGAKNFSFFYNLFLNSSVLPVINFLNEWGLLLVGIALLLGIFVRVYSAVGILLMVLYYFVLAFPYPNANSFIVDDHIIIIAGLLVLSAFSAGRVWGLEKWCSKLPVCSRYPKLRAWFG